MNNIGKGIKALRPALFALPACGVAAACGIAAAGYAPLVFDPSQYQVQQANADELEQIDADEIETGYEEEGDPLYEGLSDDYASAVDASNGYADGVWRGTGYGYKSQITVDVTISGGRITKIEIVSQDEDSEYFQPALAVIDYVIAAQSTNVDTVSGSTYSSKGILSAVKNALAKAAAAAGNTSAAAELSASATSDSEDGEEPVSIGGSGADLTSTLADGTFTGYAECADSEDPDAYSPYYVSVTIQVENGQITRVYDIHGTSTSPDSSTALSWDESENGSYLDWAANGRTRASTTYTGVLDQIEASLAAGSRPSGVDAVSGATYSSIAIYNAFYAAVAKSAAAAGSSVEIPAANEASSDAEDTGSADDAGSGADSGSGDDAGGSAGSDDSGSGSGGSSDSGSDAGDDDGETYNFNVSGTYVDGTYSAAALCVDGDGDGWSNYYIIVTITVKDGKVASLDSAVGDASGTIDPNYVYKASENAAYLKWAVEGKTPKTKNPGVVTQINNALTAGTLKANIDTVSKATYSSKAIIEAFDNAVQMAFADAQDSGASSGEAAEGDDAVAEGSNGE